MSSALEEKRNKIDDDTRHRIDHTVTISDISAEVFCVRFSPDGKLLALGCGDGTIQVFNTEKGILAYVLQVGSNVALPTTCIRFRPSVSESRTKNVLLSANAAGVVQHWHVTSTKCLHTIEDQDNQFYALDYSPDGEQFCAAGKDYAVRVFDESTRQLVCCMRGSSGYGPNSASGHSNRVFSTKFVAEDPNLVMSGGWDNTVQIWDVRAGCSIRSIYGPHICGDSLDCRNKVVLTGSWRPDDSVQLWDFDSGNLIQTIPWDSEVRNHNCHVYAAQFSKFDGIGEFIGVGGSNSNEFKIFHKDESGTSLVGSLSNLPRGVFTIDFSSSCQKVALGGGDGTIRIIDIL